jgi:hypothetical protein
MAIRRSLLPAALINFPIHHGASFEGPGTAGLLNPDSISPSGIALRLRKIPM